MKFSIRGVDIKNGEGRAVVVDADDMDAALAGAESLGLNPRFIKSYDSPEISTRDFRSAFGFIAAICIAFGVVLGLGFSRIFFLLILIGIFFLFFALLCEINWGEVARQKREASKDAWIGRAEIVCPHCRQAGGVSTRAVKRKTGISSAKATAAIFTLGLSIFATGLRRKELKIEAGCAKCSSKWS